MKPTLQGLESWLHASWEWPGIRVQYWILDEIILNLTIFDCQIV